MALESIKNTGCKEEYINRLWWDVFFTSFKLSKKGKVIDKKDFSIFGTYKYDEYTKLLEITPKQ